MSSAQNVQTVLQALRKVAVKGKKKKSLLNDIDNVASSVVLLNSSSPSGLVFDKLASVFRLPLVSLYSAYTVHTLNAASFILNLVLNNIRSCFMDGGNPDIERQSGWERVANSLLSGVINKLRDQKLLGARSLGLTISKTRDFAVLETLLNLFAILLPSSSAPPKRSSYVQDVFFDRGKDVLDLLDGQSAREWDETATKVLDILVSSDITFPQPFDVDEVVVGETKYPQPEVSDRFYVDRMSFFVNVRREARDGLYEDLQIKYTNIDDIKFTSAGDKSTLVTVKLKTPPKLGDQDIAARDGTFDLLIEILNSDMTRFKEALKHRNLNGILAVSNKPRISVSADLELDADGPQWDNYDKSSLEKVKDVETFYGSDPLQTPSGKQHTIESSDMFDNLPSKVTNGSVASKAKTKPSEDSKQQASTPELKASIFGESDEELSEISGSAQVSRKAKPGQSRKNKPITALEVIVLSENESEAEPKRTSRGGKGNKKRPQTRAGTHDNAAANTNTIYTQPLTEDTPLEGSLSKALPTKNKPGPATKEKDADTKVTANNHASIGRARRAAASEASKRLADAFHSSEDIGVPEEYAEPCQIINVYKSRDTKSTSSEPGSHGKRSASPFTTVAPRSSSPTSRVSKMRAKNAAAKNKSVKSGQKRTSDKALADDEEASSRKKPRVDVKDVDDEKQPENTQSAQKSMNRGQKAIAQGSQRVTFGKRRGSAEDLNETALRGRQSPVHPVRAISPSKPRPKKENVDTSKGESRPESTDHTLSVNFPVDKKLDAKQSTEHTSKRNNGIPALPSLEDVLLKGVPVKESITAQKTNEVDDEDSNDSETNIDFDRVGHLPAAHIADLDEFDIDEDEQSHVNNLEANYLAEPHTPLSRKSVDETPVHRARPEKPPKNALDLDTEFIDLTDENIREVLKSLRARRSRKQHELGNTVRAQASTKGASLVVGEQEPSSDGIEVPTLREIPSRHKVKFEEKPRYKSAPVESLPVQETGKKLFMGTKERKHRHPESESGSRVGSTRGGKKGQEEKRKKDPGMQEIIKVLDAIQNVIISNIESKSRVVRSDIRVARDRLIHEAVADLHEMREESVSHYNNLLALENEYANINRKLNTGFESLENVNTEICKFVRQNLSAHDRGSLPKKMARSLFASALPGSFQKFI
ncbi:hypothetical protein A7U60_g9017 [Sanghuangporus baumii]|uniref:Uncharacterized protein n=1 Tax=Sanghuangporus baumii TaxID=108892 RepID=A0A9Q5HR83_SANBA|nr:hypothetical protein A7U60_g9017 [Sanghuangporus baumii]